jgi:hypothetical protein
MAKVDTKISWGYVSLLELFAKANGLILQFESIDTISPPAIRVCFEDESDTAYSITYMSVRHLGIENMLFDFLMRCNIHKSQIPLGQHVAKRSEEDMERAWQEHRKKIGLAPQRSN